MLPVARRFANASLATVTSQTKSSSMQYLCFNSFARVVSISWPRDCGHRIGRQLSFFTEEHEKLRESVRQVVEKEINPRVDEWEEKGIYDKKFVLGKLAEIGALGITKPTEYGGLGLDYSYNVPYLEEIGACKAAGIATAVTVHTDMCTPALIRFGSDELKQRFLAPSIAGQMLGCVGVSEPNAGSDVAAIQTTAKLQGEELIINGTKMWITNGVQADWMCMLAKTREGKPHKNKSLICVPMNLDGITVAKNIRKVGQWCSDTAQIFFENVRVPVSNIIGEEGQGFLYQMLQFQEERLAAALAVPNSMEKILEKTIEYLSTRKVFDSALVDKQYIQFRLAELKTEIEAVRSISYRAAEKILNGEDATLLASMAKLKAGRVARQVTDTCLQFYGGMGYTHEMLISRAWRDSRLVSIAGGADEIMLYIISKFMGTCKT